MSRWQVSYPRLSKGPATLLLALVGVGVTTAGYWVRGLPGINEVPGWFFHTNRNLPLGPVFFVLVAAVAPTLAKRALQFAEAGKRAQALSLLMLLGIAAQTTLHFLVPDGLGQIFGRLYHGHGEFLRVAAARRGQMLETLRDYEALFASGQLGAFAGSKAPGTLAFYMLVDGASQWPAVQWLLEPLIVEARSSPFVQMVPEAAALVVVLFPILTYLTLAPLVSLGIHLLDDERVGFDAGLLYLTAPGLLLIDLHLDGALYPLLGTACIALGVKGARQRRPLASMLGGALGSLGLYCTFGLVPCLAMALLLASVTAVQSGVSLRSSADNRGLARLHVHDRRPFWSVLYLAAGMGLTLLALVLWLGFEPIVRFQASIAFHTAWKGGVPTELWRKMSLVEFGLYAGTPLLSAFVVAVVSALVQLMQKRITMLGLCTLATSIMLLALAATQGTNEVARLWLFVIPLLSLSVGGLLRRISGSTGAGTRVLAATQAALALFMKVRQPW